jgi:hypothetical protein
VNPLGSTLHHLTIIGDEIFRVRADLQNVVQNTATAIEVEAAKHREVLQHLKNGMAGRGSSFHGRSRCFTSKHRNRKKRKHFSFPCTQVVSNFNPSVHFSAWSITAGSWNFYFVPVIMRYEGHPICQCRSDMHLFCLALQSD